MKKPPKARIKRYADRVIGSDDIERMAKLTAAAMRVTSKAGKSRFSYSDHWVTFWNPDDAGAAESGILRKEYRERTPNVYVRNFGGFLIDYGVYLRSL